MTPDPLILAAAHHRAGRLDQAESLYRKAISQKPGDPQSLHLLGTLLFQTGKAHEALPLLQKAVALGPRRADFHLNLAVVLLALSRPAEAANSCRSALALRSAWPEAWYNLGCAAGAMKDWKAAIEAYRRALQFKPDDPATHYNLADAHRALGDWNAAIENFQKSAAIRPNPQALDSLAGVLQRVGRIDEAIETYRRAIALKPDFAEAFSNLGNALWIAARFHESAAACKTAIQLRPDFLEPHSNLGNALLGMNHVPEAIAQFRRAQNFPAAAHNLLWALHFNSDANQKEIYLEHRKWNEKFAKPLAQEIRPHDVNRDPNRRLRIGYVSADFREHSVGFFIEALLANHDPTQVEIFAYADLLNPDSTTARLQKIVHQWRNTTGITDQALTEMIRADKIDILVDLAGHTAGNRLLVFARKPAPIQITYLGYPDTTGLSTVDYRLTDLHADPPGMTDEYYSEKLIRLPRSFLCYRPPDDASEVSPSPASKNGFITFGSFNNLAKMGQRTIDLWIRILKANPGSRLFIKNNGLTGPETRREFLQQFTSAGIDAPRIDLRPKSPTIQQHLRTYSEMDIALDTFPYNGTTTTCEAMWMGVPVVTLAGKAHASRVGLSLLTNMNLPQLIAETEDDYVRIASNVSADLRPSMRDLMKTSGLLDGPHFARDIESAFRKIWQEGIPH
jgi:protein O-GlcNAc transferase